MITIDINVSVKNPQAHHDLVRIVLTEPALEGDMIIGYPLSSTSDTVTGMDAASISPSGQVTIIDIVDRENPGEYRTRQDDAFLSLQSRFHMRKDLMDRRRCLAPIQTVTFGPDLPEENAEDPEHPLCNGNGIAAVLARVQRDMRGEANPEAVLEAMGPDKVK